MKTYFQISLKVFTVLLTVMLVCVGCGKNGGLGKKDMSNPAMRFTDYKTIYYEKDGWFGKYNDFCIKVFDANGEAKYSDEEAEKYYSNYAVHFLFALKIAEYAQKAEGEMKTNLVDKMFDIVSNLPLDDSYPNDVREIVNKIYYDYKDRALNMSLAGRGYGYVMYQYDSYNVSTKLYTNYIRIYREEKTGSLIVDMTTKIQ